MSKVPSKLISRQDLEASRLLLSSTAFTPSEDRACVKKHERNRLHEDAPSTSRVPALEEQAYEEPPSPPTPPYVDPSQGYFGGYPSFQADFQRHQQQVLDAFRDTRESVAALTTQVGDLSTNVATMNTRMQGFDNRLSSLDRQWNAWTGLYPTPPPRNEDIDRDPFQPPQ